MSTNSNSRLAPLASLEACVARLDGVLTPWGFRFELDGVHSSHVGLYATGSYIRGATSISLCCREEVDNVLYEHTFVRANQCSRETERFSMGHMALMKEMGCATECRLVGNDTYPDLLVARDGGDRAEALQFDLVKHAAPLLSSENEEFEAIMRRGFRSYWIEPPLASE